ncbi:hypothetical protein GCM10023068_42180 [Leifsonia shinshuensis]
MTGLLDEPSLEDPAEVDEQPAATSAMAAAIAADVASAVERFIAVLLSEGDRSAQLERSSCELFLEQKEVGVNFGFLSTFVHPIR